MSIEASLLRHRATIKLVGVKSYPDAVATLAVGDRVRVTHEPDNPHDTNAMRVDLMTGQTIGYLPAGLAMRITTETPLTGFVGHITEVRHFEGVVSGADIVLDQAVDRLAS